MDAAGASGEGPGENELRCRPDNVKDIKVIEHDVENLRLRSEDVVEFTYARPACKTIIA